MSRYDEVYGALQAADARFVVVGGMAVVLSGHVRMTVDLDLVVDLAPEPAARAMKALTDLGFLPRVPVRVADFADPAVRRHWIDTKHMQVLSFRDPQQPAREVDVFVAYPLDFEALVAAAVPTHVGDRTLLVASIEDLITMKRAAGRAQDIADIEALQRAEGPGPAVTEPSWEAATFDGAAAAQAAAIAQLTPTQRVELLEELLETALACGALQRSRQQKQQALDRLWAN